MNKNLDSKSMAMILAVVAIVLVVAGFAYFKPQLGAGPPVVPVPYKRPGSEGYGPGATTPSAGGGNGAPIGAPQRAPQAAPGTP